jgi:hypothetical protein
MKRETERERTKKDEYFSDSTLTSFFRPSGSRDVDVCAREGEREEEEEAQLFLPLLEETKNITKINRPRRDPQGARHKPDTRGVRARESARDARRDRQRAPGEHPAGVWRPRRESAGGPSRVPQPARGLLQDRAQDPGEGGLKKGVEREREIERERGGEIERERKEGKKPGQKGRRRRRRERTDGPDGGRHSLSVPFSLPLSLLSLFLPSHPFRC